MYIDGFNLYHALKQKIGDPNSSWTKKYQRCDFRALGKQFIQEDEQLCKVYFFTAYAEWDIEARKRHEVYNSALRKMWVDIVLWKFTQITKKFIKDKNWLIDIKFPKWEILMGKNPVIPQELIFTTFEEKETDVNLALKIFEDAFFDNYDRAIIISGDSDIIPAIATIRRLSKKWKIKQKIFTSLLIPWTKGKMMKRACNEVLQISGENMENSLLPEQVEVSPWVIIKKPPSWN